LRGKVNARLYRECSESKAVSKRVNSKPLSELELFENDKRIRLSKGLIREWKFTGLNNTDFIAMGKYLKKHIFSKEERKFIFER
jgi:hypothetical protein